MNVVIWARVSSREQREGYSIDAQLRFNRDRAQANGWTVVREFVVAESAKWGADRVAFNQMLKWVKANAKREKIDAILSHKLDRVCRNMRDAVRLQELEDACGVRLAFVDNQFGTGAAGALSFNVMAAVAQYYSDNLRSEVLKGLDEKVRQGWPTGAAPFGYMNVDDREEPVQPHPVKGKTLVRIFELYSSGGYTFKSLADKLQNEGHEFRNSQRRFNRTALSYIINNRFYLGELKRNGQVFAGRYRLLIDHKTFDACQDVLNGKNRRTGKPAHPLNGGLLTCAFCGHGLTGERIRRKRKDGSFREHLYYRCANNHPGPDHPRVRWKAPDLEKAIEDDLASMRLASDELVDWFRKSLRAAVSDMTEYRRTQSAAIVKRKSELVGMQDRLLNAYLAGNVEEAVYQTKLNDLKAESAAADESLGQLGDVDPGRADSVLELFEWTQKAAEIWRGSKMDVRREILHAVSLNRMVSDVTLVTTKRKPFDALAETAKMKQSRADRI